jgi:hypothetical protein
MKFRLVGAELFQADRQTDKHDEDNTWLLAIMRMRLKSYVLILTPDIGTSHDGPNIIFTQ